MKTAHICRCNNCDAILYDENPQVDAVEVNIETLNCIVYPMELLNDGSESFWGCGECQTDEYLTDDI